MEYRESRPKLTVAICYCILFWGVGLLILSPLKLICLQGSANLKEFMETHHFVESECSVREYKCHGYHRCEDLSFWGRRWNTELVSSYPCLQVMVKVKDLKGNKARAILYYSTYELHNQIINCSKSGCRQESMKRFLHEWPLHHTGSCAYNPERPSEVIALKTQMEHVFSILGSFAAFFFLSLTSCSLFYLGYVTMHRYSLPLIETKSKEEKVKEIDIKLVEKV